MKNKTGSLSSGGSIPITANSGPESTGLMGDFLSAADIEASLDWGDLPAEFDDVTWESLEAAANQLPGLSANDEEAGVSASAIADAITQFLQIIPAKLDAFNELLQSSGYAALQQFITLKDILNIVRQPGGSLNLKALLAFHHGHEEGIGSWLEQHQLTPAELVAIVAQPGGNLNIIYLERLHPRVNPLTNQERALYSPGRMLRGLLAYPLRAQDEETRHPIFNRLSKPELIGILSKPLGYKNIAWLETLDSS